MQIRRLGYAAGAEIAGLDLRRALDAATVAEIRRAWLEHTLLCFPNQDLDPEELMHFSAQFGTLDDNRLIPDLPHPDHSEVLVIVNKPATVKSKLFRGSLNDHWHTDHSFTTYPTSASFLIGKELPDVGGDTLFANMYAAYDALSPAMARMLDPLEGIHDVSMSRAFESRTPEAQAEVRRRNPPVVHPVVRVHPETGRKALFLGDRVRSFVGMTEEETKPLLRFLLDHSTRYEFTYRHRWNVNDLVMWDNRCLMHYAAADYDQGQLRRMLRCSLHPVKSGYVYAPEEVLA